MNELHRNDDTLTTADLANPGTARQARTSGMDRNPARSDRPDDFSQPGQSNRQQPFDREEPLDRPGQTSRAGSHDAQPILLPPSSGGASTASGGASNARANTPAPLFPDQELHNFRARWDGIQTSFVDEPRQAVQQADSLVANIVQRIAEQFSGERAKLEDQWAKGDNVSTEDLRQSLKRYHSFFDRLLSF